MPANVTADGVSCNNGLVTLLPTDLSPVEYIIYWNNGQSSTLTMTTGADVLLLGTQQSTLVGTVTSGEFAGGAVTIVYLYPTLNPRVCATSQGVTSQSGTVTVDIVGP